MKNDFIPSNMRYNMRGLCHRCHSSNMELEIDENGFPMCIKCRDPLGVDHT